MKTNFAKLSFAVSCALALGAFSTAASAQAQENEHGLVTSPSGATVMSGYGVCVHSGYGPAPEWRQECDAAGKVTFGADVLFDSDKSALRPAGRHTLDQFADRVHKLDTWNAMAVGYADRMGTEGSNQTLSRERVDVVKAYLVTRGIAANRMGTRAWGETRPTTYAGECQEANTPMNIECMQPDRHVYVEVSGTRGAK